MLTNLLKAAHYALDDGDLDLAKESLDAAAFVLCQHGGTQQEQNIYRSQRALLNECEAACA